MALVSILAAARGIVAKRTAHDWLIIAAASLIILLATTLLSAGLIYSGAVSQSGLRRSLLDAPATSVNVTVSGRVSAEQFAARDAIVRSELAWNFDGLDAHVVERGEADSFGLPGQAGDAAVTDLATLASFEGIRQHATLSAGAWPAAGAERVEMAVSDATVSLLGLSVGDDLDLTNRRDARFVLPVRVVGIFKPNDLADRFWLNDPLLLNGVTETSSYRTYGPMIVEPSDFLSRVGLPSSEAHWLAFPDFSALRIDQIDSVGGRVTGMQGRLDDRLGDKPKLELGSGLPAILSDAQRSLLVAQTGVLILTIQLAVLAGYALLLTAGLLIDQRRVETALLRSRGASTGQVAGLALMEGVLLAVPAALLGPWLAAASLRVLNVVGPLAEIGLDLDPQVTLAAYLLAAIAAAACIVALVLPAFTAARSVGAARESRGRQQSQGIAQRAGLDLALLAVAAIGFWQLRHYGGSITASVQGQLGLDPFLVAAPAIGLLAGAVLALRLIPLLAQVLDRAVSRTRGLVSSLGAWQVARRPLRYTRSALLLMLAIALGVFAVSYSRTWTDSQRDQANFQVGADLAVTPDRYAGATIPQAYLPAAYRSVAGVESLTPVSRELMHLARTAATGTLLGVDAASAGDVIQLRPDMASQPLPEMLRMLADARPSPHLIAIAGATQRLRMTLVLTIGDARPPPGAPPLTSAEVSGSVVVRDARGMLYRFSSVPVPATKSGSFPMEIQLVGQSPDGAAQLPEYPVALAAVEVRLETRGSLPARSSFVIRSVEQNDTLTGPSWAPLAVDPDEGGWGYVVYTQSDRLADASLATGDTTHPGMDLRFSSPPPQIRGNLAPVPIIYSLQPASLARISDALLPIVVSNTFLEATAAHVGDQSRIDLGQARQPVRIVGSVEAFPTADPAKAVAVADLPTLALLRYQLGAVTQDVDEWWLSVDDAAAGKVASSLESAPFSSQSVRSRIDRSRALRTDPVALGVIGGLSLGFVSAALFAAVGFIVSASVSARERLAEFALLRALGLSPGQLSRWLSLENGLLVAISLVGGTGLGLLMSWVALPYITVTQNASRAVPPVLVIIPWNSILVLEVVTVLALGFMVLVLGALLRRIGLGAALRLGED